MAPPDPAAGLRGRRRDLYYFSRPRAWPLWPFLPVVRRRPGAEEELGLLFDALGACGLAGHSATVFLSNLFLVPATLDEFLALDREAFDTPEEVADAGWSAD
jgi:hypothetical protein